MKIWAGWTLNHRNPSSAPMISAHSSARFGWVGRVEQRDEHERDEGDDDGPAGQAVEPVGEVHAVRGGDDRERREQRRTATGRSATAPTNGTAMAGDVVGLLDLPGGDERDDRQPDELLAGPDPLPRPRVEVVVERAEQRRRRPAPRAARTSPRPAAAQEEVDAEDDDDDQQRRPSSACLP